MKQKRKLWKSIDLYEGATYSRGAVAYIQEETERDLNRLREEFALKGKINALDSE